MTGFIERNSLELIIVHDWQNFVEWVEDSGYDESYLDINDSKCMHLQEVYNMEIENG